MAGFLQTVLDNLHKIWPVRIIDADCQGVLFVLGRWTFLLSPGPYLFIPGLMRIEERVVVYQEMDCQLQSMVTKDNVETCFSGNVGYIIKDARKASTLVEDVDQTLERASRAHLADVVNQNNYDDIRKNIKKAGRIARNNLAREARVWGVDIVRVRFSDFVRCKQWRMFGGMQ